MTKPVPPRRTKKTYDRLNIFDLRVDHELQRARNVKQIDKLEREFNPLFVGTIVVSRRADGSLYIIDGQHRVEVLKRRCTDQEEEVMTDCEIYDRLSLKDEADMFLSLNQNRQGVPAYDSFHIALQAGHPIEVMMDGQTKARSLEIARSGSANRVGAVTACRRIVISDKANNGVLYYALEAAESAWGRNTESWGDVVLQGIAMVINRNWDTIDRKRLTDVMRKRVPAWWKAQAISRTTGGGGSVSRSIKCAEVLVEQYNNHLRTESKKIK